MPAQEVSESKSISNVFLKEFVRQAILNSKPKSSMSDEVLQRIRLRMSQEIPQLPSMPIAQQKPLASQQNIPSLLNKQASQAKKPMQPRLLPARAVPNMQGRPLQLRRMPLQIAQPTKISAPSAAAQKPEAQIVSLAKIKPFLSDPSVMSVECPGEGKNLTLNRSGITHSVQLTLTKQEIDSILNEFSAKTKIPLIQGVFKAIYGGLLMTAVVSDNIGSRFIIEKQFTPPSLPVQEKK